MPVEFVLGRTGSRRDEVIAQKIKAAMGGDILAPVIVIVPPQATYATECFLMEHLDVSGLMGVNVASISRFAQRVLDEVHGTYRQVVGSAGRSMAVKQVMDSRAGELKTLNRMNKNHYLPPLVADAITELKRLNITPDMLAGFDAEREETNAKLRDLAVVYESVNEKLAGYMDAEDRLALATGYVKDAAFIRGAHVFIHGFDMYNALTVDFLTQVMLTARDTTISFLYADAGQPDREVYGICDENRLHFQEAAESLGLNVVKVADDMQKSRDILHVEKSIFAHPAKKIPSTGGLSVSYAESVRAEVDGVAAQIAYLTQKSGLRYAEIAVVCGSAQEYLGRIRERFAVLGIPCFTGEKRTLLQSSLSDFVLSAFELSGGRLHREGLLAHAASGYCDLSRTQLAALQNYAYSNIRDGFAFLKEFRMPAAEEARRALMEPIVQLRQAAGKAKDAAALIQCVTDYMVKLDVQGKVRKKVDTLREREDFENADYAEQAYTRITDVLAQAAEMCGEVANGSQLSRILQAGMAAEEISVIPPVADEVRCGDVSGTYIPEVKVLFVMGANEGVIPDYTGQTDIFTEQEREALLNQLKGLRHTGSMDKQKLAIVKAFARPTHKLYISYVDDGAKQRSTLADRLFGVLDGVRVNDLAKIAPMLGQNAFELAVRDIRNVSDGGVAVGGEEVLAAVAHDAEYAEKVAKINQPTHWADDAKAIDEAPARELYGDFKSSTTRIERFYQCPYRHFVNYGLKADIPREYSIDQLDVGNFAHTILDNLTKAVQASGKDWKQIGVDEYKGIVRDCAQRARAEQEKYTLNRHNGTVLDFVQREVETAAEMIRRQCIRGEMKPHKSEYDFDIDSLGIKGVIDRIDTASTGGASYFSIVDYKTGKRDFDLGGMAAGLDIQLMIYVMAVRELLGEEYAFAGANYMRIYDALREREEALEPMYRMRGIEGVAADVAARLYGTDDKGGLFSVYAGRMRNGEYDYHARRRYYTPEQMDIMVRYTAKLVTDAENDIKRGKNNIMPTADPRAGLACTFCEYNSICRFDKGSTGAARVIERKEREALLAEMKERLEDGDAVY